MSYFKKLGKRNIHFWKNVSTLIREKSCLFLFQNTGCIAKKKKTPQTLPKSYFDDRRENIEKSRSKLWAQKQQFRKQFQKHSIPFSASGYYLLCSPFSQTEAWLLLAHFSFITGPANLKATDTTGMVIFSDSSKLHHSNSGDVTQTGPRAGQEETAAFRSGHPSICNMISVKYLEGKRYNLNSLRSWFFGGK